MITFVFGHMYSGKSEELIHQARLSPVARVFYATGDDNHNPDREVISRAGSAHPATEFSLGGFDVKNGQSVFIDEAQFLTEHQVLWVRELASLAGVHVKAYGLLNDYTDALFPGSEALIKFADHIEVFRAGAFVCMHEGCDRLVGKGYHRACAGRWLVLCSSCKNLYPKTLDL